MSRVSKMPVSNSTSRRCVPTYRLSIGVAGSSNAFAIAERLGLSPVIIERARRRLSIEEQRVDELLRRVESDLRRAEEERTEAERLRAELEEEKQKYVAARQRLHEQREEFWNAQGAKRSNCSRKLAWNRNVDRTSAQTCPTSYACRSRSRPACARKAIRKSAS